MKLLLKPFQTDAVERFVRQLRLAGKEAQEGELQAVALASPTGSGKTVMATAAIEFLLEGDATHPPRSNATFLWLSDQPELNEQTRRKMLETSHILGPSKLVVIDSTFDEEAFRPGIVYFLNIQKLGKEKTLVTPGDDRSYSIWETVNNTVRARPGNFFIFIDEAHRGMAESSRARNEAATIVQKFIKGSPNEVVPIPLIAGISATPDRFTRLIEGSTGRISRQVVVNPEDVRASGLLKEQITFYHPNEDQPSDMTMLRAAARAWKTYKTEWATYCAVQQEVSVHPILVAQVQDASGRQVSKTDLTEAIRAINEEVGPLPPNAFAHAFQEGSKLSVGSDELRYLAPSEIDADPDVQVVFFKSSLNTGWDCPRAEVMMSFRTATDATLIAQLVGRMVRTPLARRIDVNEHLNTVALYLPHYDEEELKKVVGRLTTPDADTMPPVTLRRGEDALTLNRVSGSDTIIEMLEKVPSYIVPRARKTSQIQRSMKLARFLTNDSIDNDSMDKASAALLTILRNEYDTAKETERFKKIVEEKGKLEITEVNWQIGTNFDYGDTEVVEIHIAAENVDDIFDAAGKKLGEGLHKLWWRTRVAEEPNAKTTAKLELFALCLDPAVLKKVETTAQTIVQQWLREHRSAIARLTDVRQQAYNEIRRLAADPEETTLSYPTTVEVTKGNQNWDKHLYVDATGRYPATFNSWEVKVLTEELKRSDLIGWLRNPDRKPWSLCIPYRLGGENHPLYPDFIVVRNVSGQVVVDILDPHLPTLEDAPAKAAGLAEYAAKHGHMFGRIEIIIVEGQAIKRLDLTDEQVRDKVKAVTTNQHLRQLFDAAG